MAHVINNLEKGAGKMSSVMTSEDAEKLGAALKDIKGEVVKKAQDLKSQAKSTINQAKEMVQDRPLYFVGGAVAVGLATGYLLGCAKRH